MSSPGNVTALLGDWSRGNQTALGQLLPLAYEELRGIATRRRGAERAEHTLQPTALVHELYLRLVDQRSVDRESGAHFFGVAAHVMRRILVDYAHLHSAIKRGDGLPCLPFDEVKDATAPDVIPVLDLGLQP